jgi:hypothetical protein
LLRRFAPRNERCKGILHHRPIPRKDMGEDSERLLRPHFVRARNDECASLSGSQ